MPRVAPDPLGIGRLATVADLVTRAAAAHPHRTAVVDGPRRVTWAELDARIDRVSAGLRSADLDPGDRLVLHLHSCLDFVEVYLGALRTGLTVVPVNPAATRPELRQVLQDSGAGALVTASTEIIGAAEALRTQVPGLRLVVAVMPGDRSGNGDTAPDGTRRLVDIRATDDPATDDPATDDPAAPDFDPEGVAVLLYTSGTSGVPRGAMLTHRAMLANLAQVTSLDPALVNAGEAVLVPIALSHIFGLNAGLGLALAFGATTVLTDRFDPAQALRLIADESVSVVLGSPAIFAAMFAALSPPAWTSAESSASATDRGPSLGTVRFALSGSAPLPPELLAGYRGLGVVLHEGYGLTEAAPVVTLNVAGPDGTTRLGHPKARSVGSPLPGIEVDVIDADGDTVEQDDPGAVMVRGANLFSGYWPDGSGGPDAEGWFRTGDLAVRDGDGDLILVGRESDMVLVNGFNVYPGEVEAVLARLPGVAEVAVIGVPDQRTGEAVQAYVVPIPGVTLDRADLLTGAAVSLARFKLPQRVEIVESLPHTVTGKVKKWQLG